MLCSLKAMHGGCGIYTSGTENSKNSTGFFRYRLYNNSRKGGIILQIEKKTLRNIFLGVAGCIILYWLLHETERVSAVFRRIIGVLSPFIVGAALAFVLNVPMRAIEKKLKKIQKSGVRRGVALSLTVVAVLVLIAGIFWLLIPQLIHTAENLVASMPGFFNKVLDSVYGFLEKHPEMMDMLNQYGDFENIDWSGMVERLISVVSGSVASIADFAISAVVGLYNGIFNAVLSLFFCLYALIRKEILARQGRRIIYSFLPEKFCDETVRILRMSNATFSRFISGQCLEAVILGGMFAVAMAIFKMPYIPLISVVIAVTALIPIVGAFVGCIIGAFFILIQDPNQALWFVIMFLLLQQVENNLIYPKVVGSSIGLPGMWVLVAVGVGGDLMGVAGMLIMIPLASVLYALAREITNKRVADRNIDPDKLRDHPPEITSKFKEKRKARKEVRILKRMARRSADTAGAEEVEEN